jgi:hypothetical protein
MRQGSNPIAHHIGGRDGTAEQTVATLARFLGLPRMDDVMMKDAGDE